MNKPTTKFLVYKSDHILIKEQQIVIKIIFWQKIINYSKLKTYEIFFYNKYSSNKNLIDLTCDYQ